jgi:polysaccharide biosynthesis protein VpsM
MDHKDIKIVCAAILLGGMTSAWGQIRPAYGYPAQPQGGTQLGQSPAYANWWVGAGVGYDDNLFLTQDNKRASGFYVVSPGLRIDARSPNSVISLSHQYQVGRYWTSHNDDYIDHTTHAQADWAFTRRAFGRVGLDYIAGHDPRGSTDRAIANRPDEYKLFSPSATFAFGAPGAQGRAEAYYSYANKRYTNNRATTRFSDRETQEYGGALYFRVAPKTYVLGEARQTDIDYKVFSPNGGKELRFYAGVSWEATALTTGTLKFGRARRDFDGPAPSESFNSWEGVVTWAPRTYSTFDFITSRQTNESTGLGRFIITEAYQVNWNHDWTSYLRTGLSARWQRDDYQGFARTDDTTTLGLRVGYKMRRWLVLGAEYTYSKRDSNLNFDYDKNFYLLTATVTP